jgi:alkanesulfonate monooxygenase SsuD/methylene tetrahydromethanopterin reductase-like flavin-dependent oxidoreductase (luciferase family)
VVAFYLVMMGEAYRGAMRRWGYGVDMQAILDANADKSKSPSVVPESAEAALSALAIYGAPDDVAAQVGAWYEAGADMPVLMLNPRLEPEVIDLTLEAFARG